MNLFYLPQKLNDAIKNLNFNYLTEIRLRCGQPVIIQYKGEYKYINEYGATDKPESSLTCSDAEKILLSAMEGSVYSFSEQLKKGFITVIGGVRIGVAGEYVVTAGQITAVKNITSLNVRIPHEINCADCIYDNTLNKQLNNVLIFSPPGYGKTTMLRALVKLMSRHSDKNILVFDERNEISAIDGINFNFDLGVKCDVVRGADKLSAFVNAIRALSPQIIVTDELYGKTDSEAVRYAEDCGINVVASSHTTDKEILKDMPFDTYIELTGIGKPAVVYDKAFNIICNCDTLCGVGNNAFKREKA